MELNYKKATGFTGWITYELKDKENPWNKTTHMLAHYAEYANISGNKTAAYGQTKLYVDGKMIKAMP